LSDKKVRNKVPRGEIALRMFLCVTYLLELNNSLRIFCPLTCNKIVVTLAFDRYVPILKDAEMNEKRYCKRCAKGFEAKRPDHFFCSGACVAAWYRENPNPEFIHAEKDHIHDHYCEHCGIPYKVNDYAERGGKREPKYCSPRCKQAAYRVRQKFTQEQAQRRYSAGQGGSSGKKQQQQQDTGKSRQNAGNGASGSKSGQSSGQSGFWKGFNSKWTAAQTILGVRSDVTAKELRAAYMGLIKQWHPDLNKSPDAETMTKKINWAYEYLKTN
jgi:hypothetical protein